MDDSLDSLRRIQELTNRLSPLIKLQEDLQSLRESLSPATRYMNRPEISALNELQSKLQPLQISVSPLIKNLARQRTLVKKLCLPTTLANNFDRVIANAEKTLKLPSVNQQVPDPDIKLSILEDAADKIELLIKECKAETDKYDPETMIDNILSEESDHKPSWLTILIIIWYLVYGLMNFTALYPQSKDGVQEILQDLSSIWQAEEFLSEDTKQ